MYRDNGAMKSQRLRSVTHALVAASRMRGLYARVALEMKVDPSYVSRVAQGTRRSKKIEDALLKEIGRVMAALLKQGVV